MSESRTRVITIPARRRSTTSGLVSRALPVCAAFVALALAAGAAYSQASFNNRFCGFDLTERNPRLKNVGPVWAALDLRRQYNDYVRRPGGYEGYSGFVLWGYKDKTGFEPLVFVPWNVPPEEC